MYVSIAPYSYFIQSRTDKECLKLQEVYDHLRLFFDNFFLVTIAFGCYKLQLQQPFHSYFLFILIVWKLAQQTYSHHNNYFHSPDHQNYFSRLKISNHFLFYFNTSASRPKEFLLTTSFICALSKASQRSASLCSLNGSRFNRTVPV